MSQNTTIDHEEIKKWAEDNNAVPTVVQDGDEATSILRFDIGNDDADLTRVNWEHFFELFEQNNVAFLYDDSSTFNKFISRE
jgi:hypothetical protein